MPQEDADLISVFLDEIDVSDRAKQTMLNRNDEYFDPAFTVRSIDCFNQSGYNVSRIRPRIPRIGFYRIIFAIDNEYDDFYLLGVVKKTNEYMQGLTEDGYNYEPDHWITRRILADYADLGIPRIDFRR
jgi:hypothetical protein